jgi:hypothetical protein
VPHPLRQMSCPRIADNGVTQLEAPSPQEGELLETGLVFPLGHFLGPTPLRKLTLKECDYLCKTLSVSMSRGKRC